MDPGQFTVGQRKKNQEQKIVDGGTPYTFLMNTSPNITIYGSETCAFCTAARMLLKKRGLDYDDVLVSNNAEKRQEMVARSGSETVPQIFIGGEAIGGFDELYSLEQSGELDRLLGTATNTND